MLFAVGSWTVYQLKLNFGNNFNKEALKVSIITFLFCFGYAVYFIFDWVALSKKKKGIWTKGHNFYVYWLCSIVLGIFWALLPVFIIYLMHLQNFQNLKDQKLESDEREPYRISSNSTNMRPTVYTDSQENESDGRKTKLQKKLDYYRMIMNPESN